MTDPFADAVERCRRAGGGRSCVVEAAALVGERFTTYSLLHPWESPRTAYRRRRGYCTQYNGALAEMLTAAGEDAWLVYAARVRIEDRPEWVFGHTWVRVRIGGAVVDVCAGAPLERLGVDFTPLGPVRRLTPIRRFGTAFASFGVAAAAVVGARVRGRPRPLWLEHPRIRRQR